MADNDSKEKINTPPLKEDNEDDDSFNAEDLIRNCDDGDNDDGPYSSPYSKSVPVIRSERSSVKRPFMRKVVSGPVGFGKSVKNGIDKFMSSKKSEMDIEEDEHKAEKRTASEGDCLHQTVDCAVDAVEKPFQTVTKAAQRPGRRKYTKTDIIDETAPFVPGEDGVGRREPPAADKPAVKPPRKAVKVDTPAVPERQELVMGPIMSFLLRDSTIMMATALAVGVVPTFWNRQYLSQHHIPLAVTVGWVIAAYVIGQELGREWGPRAVDTGKSKETEKSARESLRNHSIFLKASSRFSESIQFQESEEIAAPVKPKRRIRFGNAPSLFTFPRRRKVNPQQEWKARLATPRSSILVRTLNEDKSLRSVSISQQKFSEISSMGSIDVASSPAESLFQKSEVQPLLQLRGMDIFLASGDGAEDDIGNHPHVISGGLRDTSSCLVNVLLPWGNMLIYFQLPEWYDEKDGHEEKEDDPENVKALKRFLKGDNEYKTQRLRLMPSIVDGPRIVRLLAPSHTEIPIPASVVPVSYNIVPASTDSSGRQLSPLIEVEMDCMSSKTVRTMANVFKRNLSKLTLDLAVLIRCPENKSGEPCACIGMWRFDKIDVDACPVLPQREVSEAEDIRRASAIIGLPPEELQHLIEVSA